MFMFMFTYMCIYLYLHTDNISVRLGGFFGFLVCPFVCVSVCLSNSIALTCREEEVKKKKTRNEKIGYLSNNVLCVRIYISSKEYIYFATEK